VFTPTCNPLLVARLEQTRARAEHLRRLVSVALDLEGSLEQLHSEGHRIARERFDHEIGATIDTQNNLACEDDRGLG
jgi:hypothetical protein